MSFISYAQNYEDVMLWRALKHIDKGFYIDVGAAWPDKDSITKHFYQKGWRGINIEPNPAFLQKYHEERPSDINLQVAISDINGEMEIYLVNDTGLSSLNHDIVEEHARSGFTYHSAKVPVLTLQEICREHVRDRDVHFLKVDVEGWEEKVLKSNDWDYCRPWIVVVEATRPMTKVESYSEFESILLEARYEFVYEDGLNRYYVSSEHMELIPSFRYPPNVFDEFIPYQEYLLKSRLDLIETENKDIKQKLQKLIEERQFTEKKLYQSGKIREKSERKLQYMEAELSRAKVEVDRILTTLQTVYASSSWRITAPARWIFQQIYLLRQLGITVRLKALMQSVAKRIYKFVEARPAMKSKMSYMARRCGLFPCLKRIHSRLRTHALVDSAGRLHDEIGLTPSSQFVYHVLQAACQRKQRSR